jgi:hypothetical protein
LRRHQFLRRGVDDREAGGGPSTEGQRFVRVPTGPHVWARPGHTEVVVHVLVFVIAALVAAAMWGLIPSIIRRGRDGR